MTPAAAQADLSAACTLPPCSVVTSRTTTHTAVSSWRTEAMQRLWNASDKNWDRYAETGCLAALGEAHRTDELLLRLINGQDATA